MTPEEIFQQLRRTLHEQFALAPDSVALHSDLSADLDLDSIDAVDLLVAIKPWVGQRLAPDTFKNARSVQDVVNTLYPLLNA
jgi:acyl carrier protein